MEKCRKIQYPMIESTAKQKVPDPAARPSTPSVMFTALDAPTMTTTANTIQPTGPRLTPITSMRVNDNAVEVWAQYTASTAKTSAQATCAPDLPRLFSPRLRLWVTLM